MKKQMSEKAKVIRVIAFWVACLAVGLGVGAVVASMTKGEGWDPAAMMDRIAPALCVAAFALFLIMNLSAQAWGWLTLTACAKKARAALAADDEDAILTLEEKLGTPMVVSSVVQVVDMAFFPVIAWLVVRIGSKAAVWDVFFIVTTVVFLAQLFAGFALSKRSVDIEKQLNPEKRGSMLDFSFQKTWMDSCDEAEKQLAYESGFRAFRAGSSACMVLWLVSILLMFLLDAGVLPVLMVCAVWLVLQVSYYTAAARLSRRTR